MSALEDVARAVCGRDGFVFIRNVGEGAFKETFEISQSPGLSLALKVYKPGHASQRTQRESGALQRCSHGGIARLYSLGSIDLKGQTFLLALEEFIGGGTLSARVNGGVLLSVADVRVIGANLIDAVKHIASLELVHRDLKPDNILFRDSGLSPVVVDFGLVRNLAEDSLTHTWLLRGPGTPYFAPPEQLTNEKDMIDWRADQFSLGVTLSLVSLGVHPYAEPGDTQIATVERVALKHGPSTSFKNLATAAGLASLVRMVSPWPVQRFRTAAELQDAWSTQ